MQKIIDSLHSNFSDMPNIRVREIRVDKQLRKVFCVISYPDLPNLDKRRQNEISAFVKTLAPQGYSFSVSFANDHFTELGFKRFLGDLLKSKYPIFAVIAKNCEVVLGDYSVKVSLRVNATMQKNLEISNLIGCLDEYVARYTCYKVDFEILPDKENAVVAQLDEQEKLVRLAVNRELLKPSRCFTLSKSTKFIGKAIVGAPMYISDIRKASDSCVICGKVSGKSLKASKKDNTLYVCKFTLSDQSGGSISCIMFTRLQVTDEKIIRETMGKTESEAKTMSRTRACSNDRKMKKLNGIVDGMEVVVRGRIALNSFSEQLEMTVYDLSKCKIEAIGNAKEYNKSVALDYLVVRPEVSEHFEQASFVRQIAGKCVLSDKKYVVLHVNATALNNVVKDKIIAICAVKISDCNIVERWFSYVNPETEIDAKNYADAQTSPDKIVFAPTISELISDLYKFTYGLPLIGAGLFETLNLINYYASPVGYKFTNECLSQADLFSELFDASSYSKKPNCSKLVEVARQCKVPCPDVTFCRNTANTVAECLIALADNVK